MHITIAIPTFNRVKQLKKCLDSITSQSLDSDIQLSIAISNTASSDGTYVYLSKLEGPEGRYFITNQAGTDTHCNMGSLGNTIPPHADWVWLMGDDDYLESPNSISIVHEVIRNSKTLDLSFVHACQARRSARSGNVYEDKVLKLCEEFGYHEMLGWFSSIITRRDIMAEALKNWQNRIQERQWNASAFGHSAELMKLLHDKGGAFIDYPLVEPQDNQMTEESIERWKLENTAQRYYYVIDDWVEMSEQGLLKDKMPSKFFRYLTYNLWDRLISQQLNELAVKTIPSDDVDRQAFLDSTVANWQRIDSLSNMIEEPQVKKYLTMTLHHAVTLSSQLLLGKITRSEFQEAAKQQMAMFNSPVYEFNVLQNQEVLSSAA